MQGPDAFFSGWAGKTSVRTEFFRRFGEIDKIESVSQIARMNIPPHTITQIWTFLLGILIGMLVIAANEGLIGEISTWQTMIAGFLALLGAGLTIRAMGNRDREELIRKQRAAKFPLAEALSEVCRYSEKGISYLTSTTKRKSEFDERLSSDALEAIKEIAEWYDGSVGEAAGVIGPKYQLCRARSHGDIGGLDEHWRLTVIVNFAELNALSNRLFSFSRNRSDVAKTGEFEWKEIRPAFAGDITALYSWLEKEEVAGFMRHQFSDFDPE